MSDSLRMHIRDMATGEMLSADEVPKPDEVEAWLETHPGYEVMHFKRLFVNMGKL